MAKVLNIVTPGAVAKNTTNYFSSGDSDSPADTTEAHVQTNARSAGSFDHLYIRVTANTITATSTLRNRINGANGALVVSIPASTSGELEDTTNSDAVVAADKFNYQLVTGATGTSISFTTFSILFGATTNTVKRMIGNQEGDVDSSASTTYYMQLFGRQDAGGGAGQTDEVRCKYKAETAGTLQNLFIYISANTRADTTTFRSRKNAANGNMVVSVTTLSTGIFEDTSNTDSISQGDFINISYTTGISGVTNITLNIAGVEFSNTTKSGISAGGENDAGGFFDVNQTSYQPFGGVLNANLTESDWQVKARFAFSATFLAVYSPTNNNTGTTTVKMRQNAADTSLTISITSSSTGLFEDATHSVTIAATDEINAKTVTAGTAGQTLRISFIGILTTVTSTDYTQALSENTTIGNVLVKATTRNLSENATMTDTILKNISRILTENTTIADTLLKGKVFLQTLTENFTATASMLRSIIRTLTENTTITATLLKMPVKVLTETVSMLATFLGRIIPPFGFIKMRSKEQLNPKTLNDSTPNTMKSQQQTNPKTMDDSSVI